MTIQVQAKCIIILNFIISRNSIVPLDIFFNVVYDDLETWIQSLTTCKYYVSEISCQLRSTVAISQWKVPFIIIEIEYGHKTDLDIFSVIFSLLEDML